MVWSHNDLWLLTGDHGGFVKYWQSNMNNVKMYEAHKEPVRGLRWAWNSSITHSNWISFLLTIILLYHKVVILVKIFQVHSLVLLVYIPLYTIIYLYIPLFFKLIFIVFLVFLKVKFSTKIYEIEIKGIIIDKYRLK